MPEYCAAYSCTNRRTAESKTRGITFHRFPKAKDLRKKWEVALRRKRFTASDTSVICSEHFKREDFDLTGQVVRIRDGVIPSVFNFPVHFQKEKKRMTPAAIKEKEKSLRLASRNEPEASTSHLQPHDLRKGRTSRTSRKAEESQHLATQNEPAASTSHSQPQPYELRKVRTSRTSRKAIESTCSPSQDEPQEDTVSHSPPQPHDGSTSRKAEGSLCLALRDEPEDSPSHSQPQLYDDHDYALPASPTALKARLQEALARVESLEREKKNAIAREKRAKITVEGLLGDLREKNLMNEKLKEKLYFYSDLQLDFMAKQGREYTKDFREFALALHLHGPKAYEYLRKSRNFPLPHPHTLQRWLYSADDESNLSKTIQDEDSTFREDHQEAPVEFNPSIRWLEKQSLMTMCACLQQLKMSTGDHHPSSFTNVLAHISGHGDLPTCFGGKVSGLHNQICNLTDSVQA